MVIRDTALVLEGDPQILATVAQPFIERFQSGIGMNGEGVTDL